VIVALVKAKPLIPSLRELFLLWQHQRVQRLFYQAEDWNCQSASKTAIFRSFAMVCYGLPKSPTVTSNHQIESRTKPPHSSGQSFAVQPADLQTAHASMPSVRRSELSSTSPSSRQRAEPCWALPRGTTSHCRSCSTIPQTSFVKIR
jgi:hypothetical protein